MIQASSQAYFNDQIFTADRYSDSFTWTNMCHALHVELLTRSDALRLISFSGVVPGVLGGPQWQMMIYADLLP